jgi:uncharacterized protein (TIGR03067 family)
VKYVKRRRILLLVGLAVVTVSLATAVAWRRSAHHVKSPSDLDRVQGRWVATMEGLDVIMTIDGNEMTLVPVLKLSLGERLLATILGGESIRPERGTFRLNPARSPSAKEIDFIAPNGKIRSGIYDLNNSTLRLCLGTGRASASRPESFTASSDQRYSSYVFIRPGH